MVKDKATKQKKISSSNGDTSMSTNIWQDERFQHLVQDPRFRNIPKQKKKVKIDKRFQHMFTNDKFKVKYTVDKYGRKINQGTDVDLKRFYDLNKSSESDDEGGEEEQKSVEAGQASSCSSNEEEEERIKEEKAIVQQQVDLNENDVSVEDGTEVPNNLSQRLLNPHIDYARGEGCLLTDSSSDDESTDDERDAELHLDHVWGELDNDAENTEDSTRRLAVCNMDWDRIRAVDLMMLFSSFLPPCGSILSVKIYPSEFGKQRMPVEDLKGPPELVGLSESAVSSLRKQDGDAINLYEEEKGEEFLEQDSDAEEGDDYHMEKLRQYQLTRLRYYYAVVECDSVSTADKIYNECDGIEYESSATRIDLRFIPDDTTFEDEPKDICLDLPDIVTYKPRQFTTTALQQAKVDLTWDETALERRELGDKLAKAHLEDINDKELRKIIAYSTEEDEDEDEIKHGGGDNEQQYNAQQDVNEGSEGKKKSNVINKYKSLLAEINERENEEKYRKKFEMEFTWQVENDNSELAEDGSKANDGNTTLTPIEKILQKRTEKNKKRKVERKKRKLLASGINCETNSGDSDDSIPEGINMSDPYFAEEFASGEFSDLQVKRRENKKKLKKLQMDQKQLEQEKQDKQAQEFELLLDDGIDGVNKKHFSLEEILKAEQGELIKKAKKYKRRKQLKKSKFANEVESTLPEDSFQISMNDERFKAIFESADFNIDPTHPKFKKTRGTEQLIQEQLKRRHNKAEIIFTRSVTPKIPPTKKSKKQLENNLLIKSLKRKLQTKTCN